MIVSDPDSSIEEFKKSEKILQGLYDRNKIDLSGKILMAYIKAVVGKKKVAIKMYKDLLKEVSESDRRYDYIQNMIKVLSEK